MDQAMNSLLVITEASRSMKAGSVTPMSNDILGRVHKLFTSTTLKPPSVHGKNCHVSQNKWLEGCFWQR